jgi:hypothetical protein
MDLFAEKILCQTLERQGENSFFYDSRGVKRECFDNARKYS